MLGTFAAWNLGTLQARALPLAAELRRLGVRPAIITTPWDMPSEAGVVDEIDGVTLINTTAASARFPFKAVNEQVRRVNELNAPIVHVFKPKGFGGFAGQILARSKTLIVDSDDWEGDGGWNDAAGYSWPQRRVFQYQEQHLLRAATYVTAASTLLQERATGLRDDAPAGSVHLLENGLPAQRIRDLGAGRISRPSTIDPPVLLLYSRFAEFEPGWLEAFITALDHRLTAPATLRVVGVLEDETPSTLGCERLEVSLMGYVAYDRIPTILGSSTLALYPYRDTPITRAKQSVKLLEQMAAGCPVIASDVGDVARTLGDGGIALTDADPQHFAAKAVELLDTPQALDRMSVAGQERIRQDFDIRGLAQRLLNIYTSAGLS